MIMKNFFNYNGYTFIELLVVISIIAILGVGIFLNSKNFSQEQVVKKAQGEIQSYLRLAQSNATSNLKCSGEASTSWGVAFFSDHLALTCNTASTNNIVISNWNLENATIYGLYCSTSSPSGCPPSGTSISPIGLGVNFSPLYGKVTFGICSGSSTFLTVALYNSKINTYKCLNISNGGSIDVQ